MRFLCGVGSTGSLALLGELVLRRENSRRGAIVYVEVTKLGNIPDGGATSSSAASGAIATDGPLWVCRKVRTATPHRNVVPAHAIDDHTRVAYIEISSDEKDDTAVVVLHRAVSGFTEQGVTAEWMLSDNGSAYRSIAGRDTCAELGITPKRIRTTGDRRQNRTLTPHPADGWAYASVYATDTERRDALPAGLHFHNHHMFHSAVGAPPISRLNNLPGHRSYSAKNSAMTGARAVTDT